MGEWFHGDSNVLTDIPGTQHLDFLVGLEGNIAMHTTAMRQCSIFAHAQLFAGGKRESLTSVRERQRMCTEHIRKADPSHGYHHDGERLW
jgi:hypothetical protein